MIPAEVLAIEDDWRLVWSASEAAARRAQERSGQEFDLDAWTWVLSAPDLHLAFLAYFFGTWENAGRFIHQGSCWYDRREQVEAMLLFFGCRAAAMAFGEAIQLHHDWEAAEQAAWDTHPLGHVAPEVEDLLQQRSEALDAVAGCGSDYGSIAAVIRGSPFLFLRG